jgi:hypothetical protein
LTEESHLILEVVANYLKTFFTSNWLLFKLVNVSKINTIRPPHGFGD